MHCPRSHIYFRHEPFRLRRLLRAGVNVCLGTDSLASVETRRRHKLELNLFEEMRALANREPSLSPKRILQMATTAGARALGLVGQVGELIPGAFADVIAIPVSGERGDVYDRVLRHQGTVAASLIGGQWAVRPEVIETGVKSGRAA